ncbi:MAG: preprotein translocase subunit YajC [Defluviitaleaceae bacterium]|nr:preprotein translocase subunit YajC [Defluviitaleaceae bacterium]
MTDEVQGLPGRPADGGGEAPANVVTEYTAVVGANEPSTVTVDETTSPSMLPMLLLYGVVFAAMWFFLIRPQRSREKKMRELQSAITTGDNIVTSGGLFGKVADIGDDCFVVEFGTNRGIRIPVLKADVVAVRSPNMTPQPKEETS